MVILVFRFTELKEIMKVAFDFGTRVSEIWSFENANLVYSISNSVGRKAFIATVEIANCKLRS